MTKPDFGKAGASAAMSRHFLHFLHASPRRLIATDIEANRTKFYKSQIDATQVSLWDLDTSSGEVWNNHEWQLLSSGK